MAKMGRGETSFKTHGLIDHPKKSDCYGARNEAFGKTLGKYFEWTVFCNFDHFCIFLWSAVWDWVGGLLEQENYILNCRKRVCKGIST